MPTGSHSRAADASEGGSPVVYTDGACSGNPGPGGWAWVQVDGAWASGFEAATTNQRMEVTAALAACEAFPGPLTIVSDSTYVVNCWRDRWWEAWLRRGWKNSQKQPVANRDLWERFVPHLRDRADLELRWVKGHSGDRWNDVADRLAVRAIERRAGTTGTGPPAADELGEEDDPGRGRATAEGPVAGDPGTGALPADTGRRVRPADSRVPEGFLMTVTGLRKEGLDATTAGTAARVDLARVIGAWHELHPDLVVLTGLRAGAEELGADAAGDAGVPYVVVLPYPDPASGWPAADRHRFEAACSRARHVVSLERTRPADVEGRRRALARRDGWLRSVSDAVVVLTDGRDAEAEAALRRWEKLLGEAVWRLDVAQ